MPPHPACRRTRLAALGRGRGHVSVGPVLQPGHADIGGGGEREDDQDDGVHRRDLELLVIDAEPVAQPAGGELELGHQHADHRDRHAEAQPGDHRVDHRRDVDLGDHLPCGEVEALADADQHRVDQEHAERGGEHDREERRQRALGHLRFDPGAEHQEQDRQEDDLGRRTDGVEIGLDRAAQQRIDADRDTDRKRDDGADDEAHDVLGEGDEKIAIEARRDDLVPDRDGDHPRRRDDVAIKEFQPARQCEHLPRGEYRDYRDYANPRDRRFAGGGRAVAFRDHTGLSHFSILPNPQ